MAVLCAEAGGIETVIRFAELLGPVPLAAQHLADRLDALEAAEWVTDRCMEFVFADRVDDPPFRDSILESAQANIDTMLRIIAGRTTLEHSIPFGAFQFADTSAELGVPVHQFHRVYRVGVGLVWTYWYRSAECFAEETGASLYELVAAPGMIIHAYIDLLLTEMLDRYDRTQAESVRTRDHLRRSILRQVLDGSAPLAKDEIEEGLGVPVDAEHVAFVVHTERPPDQAGLAGHVSRACGATATMVYRHGVRDWLIWLSRSGGFGDRHLRRMREALERSGERVALGPPLKGLEGLGTTGRDALEAARLQELLGPDAGCLLSFEDVRLEVLFLTEPERARRFVQDELKGLSAPEERICRLRDTALIWLATGSHVTAAARLGLHEHTVRNRIAQIEEMLGQTLVARRTELLVALRLKRILDAHPASGAAV